LSITFVGSKQQAEAFLRESQQRLTALLQELKHRFVVTIRGLAERANKDRVENLRKAITALKDDMETELRSEILDDLELLTVSVRALALQTLQRRLKMERVG
jgi:iron uptake system EfeUOB component EfeO/EfeM